MCMWFFHEKLQRILTLSLPHMEFLLNFFHVPQLQGLGRREKCCSGICLIPKPRMTPSIFLKITVYFQLFSLWLNGLVYFMFTNTTKEETLHQAERLTLYTWQTVGARNLLHCTLIGHLQNIPHFSTHTSRSLALSWRWSMTQFYIEKGEAEDKDMFGFREQKN